MIGYAASPDFTSRTSFAPETTSTKHNGLNQNDEKHQHNQ